MSVLGMLAWCAAAVALWLGARRAGPAGRTPLGWLAGGAALYGAGLIIQRIIGGSLNPVSGLSFADLPVLLGLVAAAVGIAMLSASQAQEAQEAQEAAERPGRAGEPAAGG